MPPTRQPTRAPTRNLPAPPPQDEVLTPIRAHYIKKELVARQLQREIAVVQATGHLGALGPPFANVPRDIDVPFLRFGFKQFILTFPFLTAAPKDFFPNKLQPFVAAVIDKEPEDDNEDASTRRKLLHRVQRQLALFIGSATKLVEQEEVVRLTQRDLDRLELLARKRQARELRLRGLFELNIVCIRSVTEKGRVRSRVHDEFIVRTRRKGHPDICVPRRYGDFKTLYDELRKNHPDETVLPPPAKDRSTSTAATNKFDNDSTDSLPNTQRRLAREKNRLTLRGYLHAVLQSSTLASSPVLKSFLLSGPTELTPEELEDTRKREDADAVRDEGRKRFSEEIARRVQKLRTALQDVKGSAMAKDGLSQIFAMIKATPSVRDLPNDYQAVLEWARTSLAATVFHHYVASDSASESFAALKRIHGLMPYFMLKGALKISNPVNMIRTVLDIFLAQPFGSRSLLQRMFASSIEEEIRALQEDIALVADKVDDPMICEKIRLFVYASRAEQTALRAEAESENAPWMMVVLRNADTHPLSRPQIQRVNQARRAHAAYLQHRSTLADSDDDDGPADEDAWLFEDLNVLYKLYARMRDKEKLLSLIFEGTTAELLRDIITIFYAPLAQVYKAANIGDSIGDLQIFITDLIKTVEQAEDISQTDPARTVQTFIQLIQRHEPAFYSFVHRVHTRGESLFDSFTKWIQLFLTLVREGLGGESISLEYLLPHLGEERAAIMREADEVALYHYKLKVAYEEKVRRRFGTRSADEGAEDEAAQALVNGVVRDFSFGELIKGDADDLAAEDTDSDENEFGTFDSSEEESSGSDETDSDEESESEDDADTLQTTGPPTPTSREPIALPQKGKFVESPPASPVEATSSLDARRSLDASKAKPLPHSPHRPTDSRKKASVIPSPVLTRIPALLPLFVEVMRPLLKTIAL